MNDHTFREAFHTDVIREYRRCKDGVEKALSQVSDDEFFRLLEGDHDGNSIAIIVKHMAGNMRSRWRDFLTTDGEKPDRHRDTEFELSESEDRTHLMAFWEESWQTLFHAIEPLTPEELEATITIRREPMSVIQALLRQLTHYSYHAGQIVLLARYYKGEDWQSLSIPRGKSEEFFKNPEAYIKK